VVFTKKGYKATIVLEGGSMETPKIKLRGVILVFEVPIELLASFWDKIKDIEKRFQVLDPLEEEPQAEDEKTATVDIPVASWDDLEILKTQLEEVMNTLPAVCTATLTKEKV
jgi:hypothetical protein